jgi:hypothetical protein
LEPFLSLDENMVLPHCSVSELCREYATLDAERIALDHRIRNGAEAPRPDTPANPYPPPFSIVDPDPLWRAVETVLDEQNAVILALIATPAQTGYELQAKARVLESLLPGPAIVHDDLRRHLTLSLLQDLSEIGVK